MAGGEWPGCPRADCPDYGERRKDNVRLYHRYGSGGWVLFRCRTCGRTFSERQWTPFFRLLIPERKAVQILEWLATGQSIRETAVRAGVDKNTVLRVLGLATKHSRWFQAAMSRDYKVDPRVAEQVTLFLRERLRRQTRRNVRRSRPA